MARDEPRLNFEDWYRSEHARLVTLLVGVTGEIDGACEAVDEALTRAYERWDEVSVMASPAGWVYRVALNTARRRARRRAMEQRLFRRTAMTTVVPGPAGELWCVVAGLPLRQRTAVLLRHVGHLTEAEVADAMGIRRGTVSSMLRTAYASLGRSIVANERETETVHGRT